MKKQFTAILLIIILSSLTNRIWEQLILFDSNDVCFDKKIPPNDNIIIDPYNLPVSCMEYDEVGSLNLDLVFEDEFSGPIVDLSKWVGASPQRGKLF